MCFSKEATDLHRVWGPASRKRPSNISLTYIGTELSLNIVEKRTRMLSCWRLTRTGSKTERLGSRPTGYGCLAFGLDQDIKLVVCFLWFVVNKIIPFGLVERWYFYFFTLSFFRNRKTLNMSCYLACFVAQFSSKQASHMRVMALFHASRPRRYAGGTRQKKAWKCFILWQVLGHELDAFVLKNGNQLFKNGGIREMDCKLNAKKEQQNRPKSYQEAHTLLVAEIWFSLPNISPKIKPEGLILGGIKKILTQNLAGQPLPTHFCHCSTRFSPVKVQRLVAPQRRDTRRRGPKNHHYHGSLVTVWLKLEATSKGWTQGGNALPHPAYP